MIEGIIASLIAAAIAAILTWLWRRFHSRSSPNSKNVQHIQPALAADSFQKIKKITGKLQFSKDAKKKKTSRLFRQLRQSTVFFSDRFSQAFPGCRDIAEFNDPKEAMRRLDILLKMPISVEYENSRATPVWWFRGGSALHIESYERIKKNFLSTDEFLFSDVEHYKLKRLIAVGDSSYYRKFVYLEVDGLEPSGLYDLSYSLKEQGYTREEYGLYGDKLVTREEYDDGAAIVGGKVKNISGKVKLRARMVGRYNFLIAAHASPINNTNAEDEIEAILDNMLAGRSTIDNLVKYIGRLPKGRMDI
jgi:hypothetical protein